MSDYGGELPVAELPVAVAPEAPVSDYGTTLPEASSPAAAAAAAAAAGAAASEPSFSASEPSFSAAQSVSSAKKAFAVAAASPVRPSRSKTSQHSYDQMRRALADSSPVVRVTALSSVSSAVSSVGSSPSSGSPSSSSVSSSSSANADSSLQVDSLDLGRPASKNKHRSIRHHGFMSLTQDQIQKANELAASLRQRDAPASGVGSADTADPSLEQMSLEEKLNYLRNRAGAGAADLMQRIVMQCLASESSSKTALEKAVGMELAKLGREGRTSGDRDWNAEFQTLLEMEDGVDKYALLRALYSDFCYAALSYGSIIISERHLPVHQKTIRPVSLGGQAGGEKYLVQSIIFKFAVDQELSPGNWMYGGKEANDEAAMKAASNELAGLVHVFKCAVSAVHLPLAALIDLKGYRLAAFALLPIDKTTIVYGSADGGKNVVNKSVFASNKMKQLASALNLMEHSVHGTRICLAADVEAHRGHDGRLYLLDFGRLFPPEAPKQGETNPRKIFYCLLRPELVKRSDVPLSSDAFSLFQKDDSKNYTLNGQVTVSTEILHKEIIPQMGLLLSELQSTDDLMLIGTIHRSGINVRHLGELRSHVTEPRMRQLLLSEMVARCIKVMIRAAMRDMMKQYTLPAVEPYMGVLVNYLNLCFGRSVESALFWRSGDNRRSAIKNALNAKFGSALTAEELDDKIDLRECLNMRHVLSSLQKMIQFTLSSATAEALVLDSKGSLVEVSHNDILTFEPRVTHMPIIDYFCGIEIALAAAFAARDENRSRLVRLAEGRFRSTLQSLPDHAPTFFQWGKMLHAQALKSSGNAAELFASALEKMRSAVDIDSLNSEFQQATAFVLVDFAKLLLQKAVSDGHSKTSLRQAIDKFREAIRLSPVSTTRSMLEVARGLMSNNNDLSYEASFQVLELIRKNNADANKLADGLLLEWSSSLMRSIQFANAREDALRCLAAAEKANMLSPESSVRLIERFAADQTNLLRLVAVASFARSLTDQVKSLCESASSIVLTGLTEVAESVWSDLFSSSSNAAIVSLAHCGVSDAAINVLSKHSPHLFSLSLCACMSIRSDCFAASVSEWAPSLRFLNLSVCFLTDENCRELAALVNLERLCLMRTRITGDAVLPVLKACTRLQVLDIGGCANIGDKFFSSMYGATSSLMTLSLCGCPQLTSKALSSVAKIPKLSCLDLSFCDKIDDKGLSSFSKSESLALLYLKGTISRFEEKTMKKLQATMTVLEKTLSEAAGGLGGSGLYDLGSDALLARRLKSPRLSISRTSTMFSPPASPRPAEESPIHDEQQSQHPQSDEKAPFQRLSILRKNLTRRSSSSDAGVRKEK